MLGSSGKRGAITEFSTAISHRVISCYCPTTRPRAPRSRSASEHPLAASARSWARSLTVSFTAQIQAFHGNQLLGTFSENGPLTTSADNSAIFLGVADTAAEITSVVYSINGAGGSIAIN